VDTRVLLIVDEVAQGMSDRAGLEQARCQLVKERLEGVVIVLSTSTTSASACPSFCTAPTPAKPPPRTSTRGRVEAFEDVTSRAWHPLGAVQALRVSITMVITLVRAT
jgi:hypothetical protein